MGLMLSNKLGPSSKSFGWKPILTAKRKNNSLKWESYAADFVGKYNQVQFKNGFKPGTTPIVYLWFNNNGKIRMKIEGITICPNMTGSVLKDTRNISIYETRNKVNISQINSWKLVSSVVSSANMGKNRAIFSNIKINGVVVDNKHFLKPEQDRAKISRNGNKVIITVDSDKY